MSDVAVVVCLGALALIGALPRVFFRRGRLNAGWWLTAAPFVLAGATLIASLVGVVRSPIGGGPREGLAWLALAAAVAGVALIRWTLRTHMRPVSLWHQPDDRPDELVTRGAYAHVRHPFYASFLLVLLACALALPHALTLLALAGGVVLLNRTAAREERRLLEAFGHHYADYMRRSGRFLPRGVFGVADGRRNALRPPMS
jgi:protein-S-isoprenylcysteine O-methyltransferase Ste14